MPQRHRYWPGTSYQETKPMLKGSKNYWGSGNNNHPLVSVGYWFQDLDTEVHGFSCPFYKRRQLAPYPRTPHAPLDLLSGWLNARMCLEDVELLLLSCSVLSDSLRPHAYQAPLSTGFHRQKYWSGLSFPFPGNLPNSGIKLASPALADGSLPLRD